MAALGELVVHLAANTAAFSKDLGKAAHEAEKRMKDIGDAAEKAAKFISAAFLAGVGTAAVLTKQAIDSADAMTKMSQSAGIALERFTQLAYAGDLAGAGMETMSGAMARLNRNIIDADSNMGEAIRGFDALGIKVRDNNGHLKSADMILEEVADKFAAMEDGAGKAAIAQLLLGRSGAQLIPLLNAGSQGLREAAEEAQKLGLVFSEEVGKAAERFNDNLTRLNYAKKGLANTIMITLLPAMNDITDQMVEAAKAGGMFDGVAKGALVVFQTLAVLVANVSYVLKQMGMEIGAIAAQMAALARFDFDAFTFIREEHVAQAKRAREELDAYEKRVMSMGQTAEKAAEQVKQLNKAPKVEDTTTLNERRKAAEKAAKDAKAFQDQMLKEDLARQERRAQMETDALLSNAGKITERIKFLQEATRTEAELEQESYDMRLFDLEDALERKIITQEKYYQLLEKATLDHEERMSGIIESGLTERERFQRMSLRKQIEDVTGGLVDMTAAAAQHNKTYFEINKAVSTANAIVKGIEAVQSSYAWGASWGGPVAGAAMAAIAAGATAVQVAAIQATQFGSSTAPSLAGSTVAPAVQPVDSGRVNQGQTTVVHLHGETFQRGTVRRFLEDLNENSRDGGKVVVA